MTMDPITKTTPARRKKQIWILTAVLLFAALGVCFSSYSLEITLSGERELMLEYGCSYREAGAQVLLKGPLLGASGKQLPQVQVRLRGEVAEATVGKYVLTYEAAFLGLKAAAERTVRIVDTESPVITLLESEETQLPGTVYREEGYIATDNADGDITHRVIRTEEPGLIHYSVLDSSGNQTHVQREVPYHDPLPPTITLNGDAYMALPVGTAYLDPGFAAEDNVDGDLTEQVAVDGAVDVFRPGRYTVTYSVSDRYQNTASVSRIVDVVAKPRPETVMPPDKTVYLTFDDGPGPYTLELLDVLDRYGVKATFFVMDTGYDDVLREIVDRGHSIGIHSVTHDYAAIYANPDAYFEDLLSMHNRIYEITGVKTSLMRFPGGSSNTVSCQTYAGIMTLLTEAVQDAGFQYFDWNVDSNDAGGARKTETVVRNVIEGISGQPVSVVLQHDIAPYSVEAVEDIICWCLENGYTFQPLTRSSPGMHHDVYN